jgi:DUF1365 family protein
MRSAIYSGTVVHTRLRPKRHRLSYQVFNLLLDLDELETLNLKSFGVERPGVLGFRRRDHGDGVTPLRSWVASRLAGAGIAWDGGRVELLCYPRMFGFVFNPISIYFCYSGDGGLCGLLYEVHNTHGERHTYVLPARLSDGEVRHVADKTFFVSPFVPMQCTYRFRINPPGERVGISIQEDDAEGLLLTASFHGRRQEMTDSALIGLLWRYPLMTLKVVAGIHYEALKLLAKGIRFRNWHPAGHRIDHSAQVQRNLSREREPAE